MTDSHQPTKSIYKPHTQCYFLEPIKREVSQPFSTGMPKAKVCDRLKKKSAEICAIKYRKWAGRLLDLDSWVLIDAYIREGVKVQSHLRTCFPDPNLTPTPPHPPIQSTATKLQL